MPFHPDQIVVRDGTMLVAPEAFPLAAPKRSGPRPPQVAAVSRTQMNTLDLGPLEALRLTITDEGGRPRAGIKVSIARPELDFDTQTKTGGDGSLILEDLEPGHYRVSFDGTLRWLPTVPTQGGVPIPVRVKLHTEDSPAVEEGIRKDVETEHMALIEIEKEEESAHA